MFQNRKMFHFEKQICFESKFELITLSNLLLHYRKHFLINVHKFHSDQKLGKYSVLKWFSTITNFELDVWQCDKIWSWKLKMIAVKQINQRQKTQWDIFLFYFFRLYTNTFCKMIIHQNQNELNEISVNLIIASSYIFKLFHKD